MHIQRGVAIAFLGAAFVGVSGCGALPSLNAVWNPMTAWRISVNRDAKATVHYDGWGAKLQVAAVSNKPEGASWQPVASYHALGARISRHFDWWAGPTRPVPFNGLVQVVITWQQGTHADRLTEIYRLRPDTSPRLVSRREHQGSPSPW